MEEIWGNWRTMVSTLNIDERASQITQVKQVTNKNLSACLFQFLRTRIVLPHKSTDRESLSQKIQYGGRRISASRPCDENSRFGHDRIPL
jgi:hypothetical protein